MKIFLDTEFLEGPQAKHFCGIKYGNSKPVIDLISIGMVDEEGKELYLINKEFNVHEAWYRYDLKYNTGMGDLNNESPRKDYWIRENVLWPIYWELCVLEDEIQAIGMYSMRNSYFGYKEFCRLLDKHGKTRKEIKYAINDFVCPYNTACTWAGVGSLDEGFIEYVKSNPPEFYTYYGDYDWVVFCQLYGRMIDLPSGFPMYSKDLKQILDDKVEKLDWLYGRDIWSNSKRSIETIGYGQHQIDDYPATFDQKLEVFKELVEYPKQKGEHNALSDAKWNKELYEFLRQN